MTMMPTSVINIRYFLFKQREAAREKWADKLHDLLGVSKERAEELLVHGQFSVEELKEFSKLVGHDEFVAVDSPYFEENVDVLLENVRFLAKSIGQKKLADKIEVSKDTVSRWCRNVQKITQKHLDSIHHRLRLPSNVDLNNEPVFLFLTPFDDKRRKEWINEKINNLDPGTLSDLFPALEKLLKDQ